MLKCFRYPHPYKRSRPTPSTVQAILTTIEERRPDPSSHLVGSFGPLGASYHPALEDHCQRGRSFTTAVFLSIYPSQIIGCWTARYRCAGIFRGTEEPKVEAFVLEAKERNVEPIIRHSSCSGRSCQGYGLDSVRQQQHSKQ